MRAVEHRELVIIGGGPAGMAAALEARRAGVQTTLIDERPTLGGQIYKQPPTDFQVRLPARMGKEYAAGHPLVSSRGRGSPAWRAFFKVTGPYRVNATPWRPLRVGSTQSNISMPRATPSTRSSGVPTPIR